LSGATYVERLGEERCEVGSRAETIELVRGSVARLRGLRMALPGAVGTTLAYGDLKPEHVLFPDGLDGRPVLLDPGLLRGSPMVDVAKLISRTVLLLAVHRPGADTARQVVEGIGAFAEDRGARLSGRDRRMWLRGVLTLWLMDTVNIVSTYLSAPAALPLPTHGLALVDRAVPVCSLVDEVSADLANRAAGHEAWDGALAHALAVAS
jgi:hypothetical protein